MLVSIQNRQSSKAQEAFYSCGYENFPSFLDFNAAYYLLVLKMIEKQRVSHLNI